MRIKLQKGQRLISSFQVALPNDQILEIDIYAQEGGGILVAQTYVKRNRRSRMKVCGWCNGVSLGCVECLHGAALDCVNMELKCTGEGVRSAKKYSKNRKSRNKV